MENLQQKEARVETIVNNINDWFEKKREFWAGFDRHPMRYINYFELAFKFITLVLVMGIAKTYVPEGDRPFYIIIGFIVQESVKIALWQKMMNEGDYSGSKKYIAIILDIITRAIVLSIAIKGSMYSQIVIFTVIISEVIRIPNFMVLRKEKDIVRISQILTLIETAVSIAVILIEYANNL